MGSTTHVAWENLPFDIADSVGSYLGLTDAYGDDTDTMNEYYRQHSLGLLALVCKGWYAWSTHMGKRSREYPVEPIRRWESWRYSFKDKQRFTKNTFLRGASSVFRVATQSDTEARGTPLVWFPMMLRRFLRKECTERVGMLRLWQHNDFGRVALQSSFSKPCFRNMRSFTPSQLADMVVRFMRQPRAQTMPFTHAFLLAKPIRVFFVPLGDTEHYVQACCVGRFRECVCKASILRPCEGVILHHINRYRNGYHLKCLQHDFQMSSSFLVRAARHAWGPHPHVPGEKEVPEKLRGSPPACSLSMHIEWRDPRSDQLHRTLPRSCGTFRNEWTNCIARAPCVPETLIVLGSDEHASQTFLSRKSFHVSPSTVKVNRFTLEHVLCVAAWRIHGILRRCMAAPPSLLHVVAVLLSQEEKTSREAVLKFPRMPTPHQLTHANRRVCYFSAVMSLHVEGRSSRQKRRRPSYREATCVTHGMEPHERTRQKRMRIKKRQSR